MINSESEQDFYQIDFTTASDWEIFIARLEEILCEWNLTYNKIVDVAENQQEIINKNWIVKSEKIYFKDVEFLVTYYHLEEQQPDKEDNNEVNNDQTDFENIKPLEDMMCLISDFKKIPILEINNVNNLAEWYGLKDFVVLTSNKYRTISSESKVKLLISSFCIAAGNIRCEIPIFIQVLETWQNYYTGICISKGVRAEYQMVHLKKIPANCKYLNGVLAVFKSHVAPSSISLDPILISVRFSYRLQDWLTFSYNREFPDENNLLDIKNCGELPFGATCEPINELILYATWPELYENIVVDSEMYTDLDPMLAPEWSLRIIPVQRPNCALSDYMLEYLEKCCSPCSTKELIGDLYQKNPNEPDLSQSLSLLTETKLPVLSKLINEVNVVTKRQNTVKAGFIPDNILVRILYFLFPDADTENPLVYGENENFVEDFGLKGCPFDDLIWRLSLLMGHAIHMLGGIRAAANLWYEFIQELRYRWENNILIPGVQTGSPDHKTCLIHQKLQMLNCCIQKRLDRYKDWNLQEPEDTEDEEFYECQVDNVFPDQKNKFSDNLKTFQPIGRLEKYRDLKLIRTGENLYIPITQEVTPKTEDQLEQDAELLIQLGSDSQGSELRSRLMSASLYSDMESFKAANPGAVLEDFIRWYSPRDWIEETELDEYGQKKGQLSARMMLPGNMWKEVWDTSKPVPALKQKRLFDDTKEAEKILYFFDSLSPSNALRLLLPAFIQIAIFTTSKNIESHSGLNLELQVSSIIKKARSITRCKDFDLSKCQELVGEIASIESIVSQYISLKFKLFPEESLEVDRNNFIKKLIDGSEVKIPNGSRSEIGNRIIIIFSEIQKIKSMAEENSNNARVSNFETVFPSFFEKQFCLRVRACRPSSSSRKLPQKLVVKILSDEIIMAGCYSQDTIFI